MPVDTQARVYQVENRDPPDGYPHLFLNLINSFEYVGGWTQAYECVPAVLVHDERYVYFLIFANRDAMERFAEEKNCEVAWFLDIAEGDRDGE